MKEKAINILLLLISIFAPTLIVPEIYNPNYNILKLIILLILGLFLLILLMANYKHFKFDNKDILVLIFIELILLSTLCSSDIKKSIIGEKNRYEGMIMFLIYTCIYLASKKYFKYNNIKIFLNVMYYVSLLIGILAIAQRNITNPYLNPIFGKGVCATFGNSNFFGSYISLALPITLAIFVLYGNKRSFLLAILMFFNLISSGTRSAWLAFGIVSILGIIYLVKNRNIKKYIKRATYLSAFFIVISIYLFNAPGYATNSLNKFKNDMNNLKEKGLCNEIGSYRIAIWRITLKVIENNIIVGCGPDNLKNSSIEDCPEETIPFIDKHQAIIDKAHNEYLQIAATIGIPALIIYLILILLVLLPRMKDMFKDNISYILVLTVVSYLVQAFFNISTIGIAPLYWMLLGIADNSKIKEKL